jgi:hypothetical protein
MNPAGRRPPDMPAGDDREFVVVDESGDFTYFRSNQELMPAFEYVGEAACIIDHNGSAYRLALGPDGLLVLGPSFGPVEFHWLRQAWLDEQNAHPDRHRLRRFFPITPEGVVSDLFEILTMEQQPEPVGGSWSLDVGGLTSYAASLADVDRRLARHGQPEHIHVKDPFGHVYRPVRHRRHWYLPATAGFNLYVEVPDPAPPA